MPTMFDVDPTELINEVAKELKTSSIVKPPVWAKIVKTGAGRERPPANKDWWYIRAASMLRAIRLLGPVGVSKLRTKYGNKKNRGVEPEKHYDGSGSIIRKIMQQLEKADLLKKVEKDIHKGRILTPKGVSLLDKTASKLVGSKPKQVNKEPEIVQEKPAEAKPVVKEQKQDKPAPKAPVQVKEKKQEPKQPEHKPAEVPVQK